MRATLWADRTTDKVQSHGHRVVRLGSATSARARSHVGYAVAIAVGAPPARGDPGRSARRRGAAALLTGARRASQPVPGPDPGVLRPAPGRGVPDRTHRLGHAGRADDRRE